jgi:hypothetical protein
MKKKTNVVQIVFVTSAIVLTIVGLSGCTSNTAEDNDLNDQTTTLVGTWVGTLQIPLFGGNSNATVSQITFTGNRTEMMLSSGGRTMTMNYTYTTTSETIVLTPVMERSGFPSQGSFNGTFPQNGTMPPRNETWSPNGTRPPGNGTWPPNGENPYNGTSPSNGTRPTGNIRPSMTITFTYAFNKEPTVLYLNNNRFTKVT